MTEDRDEIAAQPETDDARWRVADACSKLGPRDKELVERVLAKGGRATLEETAADPAAIARLERLLGWFGFEGEARAGPNARVSLRRDVVELVASSIAGVPSLRRRPLRHLSLESRLAALPATARAALAGAGPSAVELDPRALARELSRPERVRARIESGGASLVELVRELVHRGGVAPLVSLARPLRELALDPSQPLERALLGEVGRLERGGLGLALDQPAAALAREVFKTLALEAAPRLASTAKAPSLEGTMLAVFPALALAREGELRETRKGALERRAIERLQALVDRAPRALGRSEDEPLLFARALVASGLLEAREDGLLAPGPGASAFTRGDTRARFERLLEGYERSASLPGGDVISVIANLTKCLRDELLELDQPVPPELPARLAVYRWLEQGSSGSASDECELDLDDAVSLAWAIAVPSAEAAGLVASTADAISPTALAPSRQIVNAAPSERPAIVSADGEVVVLPLPGAALAAIDLSRVGERRGSGEALRFQLTEASVRAAQLSPEEAEVFLMRLRALARGEIPAAFERLLRDAGATAVRARQAVLRVLEVPRVAAAERAARVLGDGVVDRLTPTLLVLREPLTPAQRRALAREGVFVDP